MRTMVVVGAGVVAGLVVSCGGAQRSAPGQIGTEKKVRPGVPPPGDEAGFRALLSGPVVNGGLWFSDPDCRAQFGAAGTVAPAAFDAFAHCVAALHIRPTGRADWLDDASVLTDDAGFELEARVVAGHLDFIGFSARSPGVPDLPTITPAALEMLRIEGDANATISDFDARTALPPLRQGSFTEHLRLCLDATGALKTIMPGAATFPASLAAFSAVVRTWKFKPFVIDGAPTAVCSVVPLRYPRRTPGVASGAADDDRLPGPVTLSKAGHPMFMVQPGELEAHRATGTKMISPDDEDKARVATIDQFRVQGGRLIGTFKLCVDETGHYDRGTLLRSTGLPGYDAKIARTMMAWTFRPHLLDGIAVPVCTAVTFIYSQR